MEHDELFEILDAINPQWRSTYATLRAAVERYGLWSEYYAYMRTPEGRKRKREIDTCPDTLGHNKLARRSYARACRMVEKRT